MLGKKNKPEEETVEIQPEEPETMTSEQMVEIVNTPVSDKPPFYEGRLYSLDGNLYADQRKKVGERQIDVHDAFGSPVYDDDGDPLVITMPVYEVGEFHGHEVKHDLEKNQYVWVDRDAGDTGHFEDHHKRFLPPFQPTRDSDPETAPHHYAPAHDDPNVLEDGSIAFEADHVAPYSTGHTEAYTQ